MTKRTIAIFFIVSILMDLIGLGLLIGGLIGSTYTTSTNGYSTNTQVTNFGNLPLFITGVTLLSLSVIPFLIAWIGALINLARLQEWIWFVLMLIFSWITLLVYLFAGPTTPRVPQYAQYMPPQQPQNYPPPAQNYPPPPQNYSPPPQNNPQPPENYPQS